MGIIQFCSYIFFWTMVIIFNNMRSSPSKIIKQNSTIESMMNFTEAVKPTQISINTFTTEPEQTTDVTVKNQENLESLELNYTKLGKDKLLEAMDIINSGVWNFFKRTVQGDSLFIRKVNGHNIFRLTGVVDLPAEELFFILYNDIENYPKWNPSFLKCKILEVIDEHTDISYQVTAPAARGFVPSRDFVTLRHWIKENDSYITGTYSVNYNKEPEHPEYTRGTNGPGCLELRPLNFNPNQTEFRWLLNTRLNGWLPQLIVDNAFKKFMIKYMISLRQYCFQLKKKKENANSLANNTIDNS